MKDGEDFRLVEPEENAKIVTNKTGENGLVLCPGCGRGATWKMEDGKWYTSPMRKLKIPNRVDALVHQCCTAKVWQQAMHGTPKAGK